MASRRSSGPAPTVEQAFGTVLRELRGRRGLSQEALSFACARHRTYVSLLERGKNSPSLRTIFLLADALDVTAAEIVALVQQRLSDAERAENRSRRASGST